jgi:hypothetical protein
MNEEEEFFAWVDGELTAEDAARVEARVAASPELAARADDHRRLTSALRGAFAPVMEDPVEPPRFGSAEVVDFGARQGEHGARRTWFGWPNWAAMAATLVMGLVIGQLVGGQSDAPIEARGGVLVAAASLDQALDKQLASAGADGPVRVGLTFRDREGAICRSFTGEAGQGLACRADGDWRIEGLFASPVQASDYRMAAGEDPRLASLIEERIAGEPFDASAERAASEKDWR